MIKRILALSLVLAFLAQYAFAVNECNVNFYLDVPIQVIDQDRIGAQGVNVSITYQKRSSHFSEGPEYVTTDPQVTGNDGTVLFKLLNTVPNAKYLDCKLKVGLSYMNYSKVFNFDLKNFYGKYVINMSASRVVLSLKDSSGSPISGSMVFYPDSRMDINGSAEVLLPYGPTPAILLYNGHKQSITLNNGNATPHSLDVMFKTYQVNITVLDEYGNGIPFTAQIGAVSVSGTGSASTNMIDIPSTLKVSASGAETYRQVNPDVERNITVYFDTSAPLISNIRITPLENGNAEISYSVTDPGAHASGLHNTGAYINSVYYPAEAKAGLAKVSVPLNDSFPFEISAVDNSGNSAKVSGNYIAGSPSVNQSGSNATGGTKAESGSNDNTLLFVLLGVVVIIVLALMFRFRGGE